MALAAAALCVVAAAPANAATPTDKKIAALQKQVQTLQKQVKVLQLAIAVNFAGDACFAANTGDIFQSTWSTVDDLAKDSGQRPYFNPGTTTSGYQALDDKSACKDIEVARAIGKPPVATVYQQLVNFFYG